MLYINAAKVAELVREAYHSGWYDGHNTSTQTGTPWADYYGSEAHEWVTQLDNEEEPNI